jgi:hypothetical protein
MKASLALSLFAISALANSQPDTTPKAVENNDDFWAQKPMHTTDLMAGKTQEAANPTLTHTRLPSKSQTARPRKDEVNEL